MLADLVSLSVILCYIFPVFMYLKSGRVVYMRLLIGVLIVAVTVPILKRLIGDPRPTGAKNCDLFNSGRGSLGFPSGHVATVTAFIVMFYMMLGLDSRFLITGLIWTVLIAWSRLAKSCHTLGQVVGGFFTGVVLGYVWSRISQVI